MVSDDEMSGIFHAVVRTAEGRVVEYDGDEDEIDFWLAEFKRPTRSSRSTCAS
jgi:hypothetical protein